MEHAVDPVTQLTKLLATYGISALVIFMFFQLSRERKSLAAAQSEEQQSYYRRRGTVVLLATIVFAFLASGAWVYEKFVFKPKVVIEGRVRNLPDQKVEPARLGDEPQVVYRLDAVLGNGRFYPSRATSLGNADLDLGWALISPHGVSALRLIFQREFCLLESGHQDFQVATLDNQPLASRLQRAAPIKYATIDLKGHDEYLDEPIQLVYEPAANVKEIGHLFIVQEKGNKLIPWETSSPASPQSAPPSKSAYFGLSDVAWAEEPKAQGVFGPRGELSPDLYQQLEQYLESENLKQQVEAQGTLAQGGVRSFQTVKRLLSATPTNPLARNRLVHNVASAIGTIETIRTNIPWDVSLALAQALYQLGDYELSANFFSKIPDSKVLPSKDKLTRAISYLNTKRYQAARTELLELLEATGDSKMRSVITTNLGLIYSRQGNLEDAIIFYRRALALNAKNVVALSNLGTIEMKLGNYSEGEELFLQGYAMDPSNPLVLNNLADSYAQQGKNLDKALAYIDEALVTGGENSRFLDTKGWVLYKIGQPRLALGYLEKALLKEPDNKVIRAHRDKVRSVI